MKSLRKFLINLKQTKPTFTLFAWTFILVLGVVFTFAIPPFQKPDENYHYLRAAALARGQLTCKIGADNKGYFLVDRSEYDLLNVFHLQETVFNFDEKIKKEYFINGLRYKQSGHQIKVYPSCHTVFLAYVPNTLGMSLTSFLDRPLISFYAGRFTGFAFFAICLFFALKVVGKRYKKLILFYGLIPLVLHQASAISYDVMQLSLAPLLFAFLTNFIERIKIKTKQLIIFLSLLGIFITSRSGYYPIFLIYFLIPYKNIAPKFKDYLRKTSIITATFVLLILYSVSLSALSSNNPPTVDTELQRKIIFSDFPRFFQATLNSLNEYGAFYVKSTVGAFGWLDYEMNEFFVLLYIATLGVVLYKFIRENPIILGVKQTAILGFSLIATTFLIFVALYLIYSPVSYKEVVGLQGRYFLPILFLIFLFFSQLVAHLQRKKLLLASFVLFLIIVISNILWVIYSRYYDYSRVSVNNTQLEETISKFNKLPSVKEGFVNIDGQRKFILKRNYSPNKLLGFQFYMEPAQKPITTPYKWYFKDKNCNNTFKQGYLDQAELQQRRIYTEFFGQLSTKESRFCLIIKPIVKPTNKNYIKILEKNDEILMNLIFRFL